MAEPIIRAPEPGEFPETWGQEISKYAGLLRQFLTQSNPESAGAQIGQTTRDALGLATMGIGARPAPTGFRALSDAATRMAVQRAQQGDIEARNALIENQMPMVRALSRRARPMDYPAGGVKRNVSGNDLVNEAVAEHIPRAIKNYDPAGQTEFGAAVRGQLRGLAREARRMESTVPQPTGTDEDRMGARIRAIETEFMNKHGLRATDRYIGKKLNQDPENIRRIRESQANRPLGRAVSFEDLNDQETQRFASQEGGFGQIEQRQQTSQGREAVSRVLSQMDPTDKRILELHLQGHSQQSIADQLYEEKGRQGGRTSATQMGRRIKALTQSIKDVYNQQGFQGKPELQGGGHEVRVDFATGGSRTFTAANEEAARKIAREYLGGDAKGVYINGKRIDPNTGQPLSGGSDMATYRGYQEGYGSAPGTHLWDLVNDIKDAAGNILHPKGSTVGENTIKKYGVPFQKPMGGGSSSGFTHLTGPLSDTLAQQSKGGGYLQPGGKPGQDRFHQPDMLQIDNLLSDSRPRYYQDQHGRLSGDDVGGAKMVVPPSKDIQRTPAGADEFIQQLRQYLAPRN